MKKEEITIMLDQKIAKLSSINSVRRFLKHKHLRHLQNLRDKKIIHQVCHSEWNEVE